MQEPDLLFGPSLRFGKCHQGCQIFLNPAEVLAGKPLEIRGKIMHRLLCNRGVQHRRIGAIQQHISVQGGQEQGMNAQLERYQREDSCPIGGFVGLSGVGHKSPTRNSGDQGHDHALGQFGIHLIQVANILVVDEDVDVRP